MTIVRFSAIAIACTQLSGCFFVFIPGSLVQKTADVFTGAEGEHCVSRNAAVGDKITLSNGTVGTVKSLSGESSRCQGPYPIRAALTF